MVHLQIQLKMLKLPSNYLVQLSVNNTPILYFKNGCMKSVMLAVLFKCRKSYCNFKYVFLLRNRHRTYQIISFKYSTSGPKPKVLGGINIVAIEFVIKKFILFQMCAYFSFKVFICGSLCYHSVIWFSYIMSYFFPVLK